MSSWSYHLEGFMYTYLYIYTSQVLQDFFHQHYSGNRYASISWLPSHLNLITLGTSCRKRPCLEAGSHYTPENKHGTWKHPLEEGEPSTNRQFSGSMFVLGGVNQPTGFFWSSPFDGRGKTHHFIRKLPNGVSGSTMSAPTVTMDKIPTLKIARWRNPWWFRVSPFFRVVSSDDKANPEFAPNFLEAGHESTSRLQRKSRVEQDRGLDLKLQLVALVTFFGQIGVFKNNGTPKWMVYFMENLIKMDDLGVPLSLETPKSCLFECVNHEHLWFVLVFSVDDWTVELSENSAEDMQ